MNSLNMALNMSTDKSMTFENLHKKLDLISLDSKKMEEIVSTEGLASFISQALISLADVASSLVLVNKTNGLSMLSNFKRTELRQYHDKNFATIKRLLNAPITMVGSVELVKPTGMKGSYTDTMGWLMNAYKTFPAAEMTRQVLKHIIEIHESIKASDTQEEFNAKVRIEQYERTYKGVASTIDKMTAAHAKLFVSDIGKVKSVECTFKDCYKSVKDIGVISDALLSLEGSFIKLGEVANLPNQISDKVGKIENNLRRAEFEISKKFLNSLIEIVRTGARVFETLSLIMHTQLTLEHNHVLNHGKLDDAIKKHNSVN